MASLLGKALRPRAEAPVPYTSRRSGSAFGSGNGTGTGGPMGQMSQVATLYSVVDRVCTAVTAPDWDLYRTPPKGQDDAERETLEVEAHAAARLWAQPNPHMTQAALIEMVQQHVELSATGDGFLVVVKAGGIPVELWPVRPDRMTEVPDPRDYLKGWIYKSPDGDKIPLAVDEVLHLKGTPDPTNPYRGLGRVQALMRDLEGAVAAGEYTANFFRNSAQPGGIIEVEQGLTDDEFDTLRRRWQEQHRGVQNAHRVAILEYGKWVDRSFSMRDLDMSSLRTLSRDQIFEAWGVSRATMGLTDGVNYAAAKAADTQFAKLLTEPRLERWKQLLNGRLLPMFGNTGKGVEFDYCSPVPGDADEENAERTSRVQAAATLLNVSSVRFDPAAVLEAFGLPDIPFEDAPEPPAPVMPPQFGQPPALDPADQPDDPAGQDQPEARHPLGVRAQGHGCTCGHPVTNAEGDPPDLSGLDAQWRQILDRLLARWADFTAAVRAQLAKLIRQAIDDNDLPALARLEVDATEGTGLLAEAMTAAATAGAASAVAEGTAAGVALTAVGAHTLALDVTAEVVSVLLADDLANAAGREALRVHTPEKSGDQVAAEVDAAMRQRSTAPEQAQLGGALTGAINEGRVKTFASGPVGSLYADEQMDKNTCKFCRAINGRFICTTEDLGPYERLYTAFGGYKDCLGGVRCRGTVTGVWRPKTVDNPEESP